MNFINAIVNFFSKKDTTPATLTVLFGDTARKGASHGAIYVDCLNTGICAVPMTFRFAELSKAPTLTKELLKLIQEQAVKYSKGTWAPEGLQHYGPITSAWNLPEWAQPKTVHEQNAFWNAANR